MTDQAMEREGLGAAGVTRLAVAVVQGALLWWLHHSTEAKAWPATEPALFAPLLLITLFTPMVLLAGIGRMRPLALALWGLAVAAVAAGLGWWDIARQLAPEEPFPHPQTVVFGAAAVFIAHHLLETALVERRPIAPYPAYFDAAWKRGVQLVLSGAFTGVFWLLLLLGSALFKLIGLNFLEQLIRHEWFAIPATTVMFSAAVQLTDVRVGILRGVRTVGLTLLSWLMPLMALIAVGFLAALPFTGLKPLWDTGNATALLLAAAAALIILLNAAYQDGEEARAPALLRWAGRATALALTPLVALAAYGLWLRIGQHGLSADRVIAAACVLAGACYAVGYAIAAVRPGPWLKPLETTNVATAFVVLALIAALFSPLADPARIGVADQVKRLEAGKVAADKFDYAALRFDGARWGREALERLAKDGAGPNPAVVREKAAAALKLEHRYQARQPDEPRTIEPSRIQVWPKGRSLPDSFLKQEWDRKDGLSPCVQRRETCDAFLVDLDGDAVEEVLLSPGYQVAVFRFADGRWSKAGELTPGGCSGVLDALKAGKGRAVEPQWRDLEVNGARLRLQPDGCAPEPARR